MRAPDAPIGCPSATAPPLTFTRSASMLSMRTLLSATEAKASLISHRSMSDGCSPALSSAFSAALAGVRGRGGGGRGGPPPRRPLGGRGGEVGELVDARRRGGDRGGDLLALALGPVLGGQHQRAGAVVDARRV